MRKLFCVSLLFISFMLCGFTGFDLAEPAQIPIPFSAAEVKTTSYVDVAKLLVDSGFSNVTTDEVYDLSPNSTIKNNTSIRINGYTSFKKNQEIPAEQEIIVSGHFPYVTHHVSIEVDFKENILFNKYDVVVSFGENKPITLEHGEDAVVEFDVPTGKYDLKFARKDKTDWVENIELEVSSDLSVDYNLYAFAIGVGVSENSKEASNQLAENEVSITYSNNFFIRKEYKEVMKILKEMGFTNVKTKQTTEPVWGKTPAGMVTSVSINGKTTFSNGDRYRKDSNVVVYYHIPTVSFSEETITVIEGDSFLLIYTVPELDCSEDVDIKIKDETLLEFSSDDLFTALAPGKTTISAYYDDICLAKCDVLIEKRVIPIFGITLEESEKTIAVGSVYSPKYTIEPQEANYTEVQYQFSNEYWEEIEKGVFYSTTIGDTEIAIFQDGRLLGTVVLHAVDVPVESITFAEEDFSIGVGKNADLEFALLPDNATTIGLKVTTGNSKVATAVLDKKGKHVISTTGIAPGKTTITITSDDGIIAKKEIVVTEIIPESIEIKTESTSLQIGSEGVLSVEYRPLDVTKQKVTWKSNNDKVIKISKDGTYKAVSVGTASISAIHASGIVGTVDLEVLPIDVEEIKLASDWDVSEPFYKKNTMKLKATVLPENATDKAIVWTSSNDEIVTVSEKGVVKAIAVGKATITATASNGKTARYPITVDVSPQKFKISASIKQQSNDHVGSNWSTGFEFNDEKVKSGSTVSIMPGEYFSARGWAEEKDSKPDYGSYFERLQLTDEMCRNGFTIEGEADVRENGGRYSGSISTWYVKIKFTPVD